MDNKEDDQDDGRGCGGDVSVVGGASSTSEQRAEEALCWWDFVRHMEQLSAAAVTGDGKWKKLSLSWFCVRGWMVRVF